MALVDAHCHFERPEFDGHRERLLEQMSAAGIRGLVMPGTTRESWSVQQSLCRHYPTLGFAPGLHPWWASDHTPQDLEALEDVLQASDPALAGIGECGLDRLKGHLDDQYSWFEAQVALARDYDLPLLIHSVRTHETVIRVLGQCRYARPALLHGFSGSYEQGCQLMGAGLFIGVTGLILWERARKTRDAVARLPLDALIVETDAPDMPLPGMSRGDNTPLALTRILDALAAVRPESRPEIEAQLARNVAKIYPTLSSGAWQMGGG